MVHAHTHEQQALERLAERRVETAVDERLLDGLALLLRRDAETRERLSALERLVLREMHDVDGRLFTPHGQLNRAFQRRVFGEQVLERHRSRRIGDRGDRTVRHLLDLVGDGTRVAERSAHQQELRVRQREQRNLPRPSALAVAEEMELIERCIGDVCTVAVAQGLVRQNLSRAADDGSGAVYRYVAGDHADVVATEPLREIEELLAHQRLDGRRVEHALPCGER